jgi:hypothetical protein
MVAVFQLTSNVQFTLPTSLVDALYHKDFCECSGLARLRQREYAVLGGYHGVKQAMHAPTLDEARASR